VKPLLRVLVIEDSEFDAQMMLSFLRKGGYEVSSERVETAEAMDAALKSKQWDLILADYNLPNFNALAALKIAQDSGLDLPFMIVSGGIGEDIAVEAMKAGAHDYLMKGNLHRLAPAVERELREAAMRASQREAKQALLESERRYRLLWETCPDAVILMDVYGKIIFANPAVREVFGYTPEEIIGKSLGILQSESLRGGHQEGINRYLGTGVKKLNWRATETVGRRKDGAEIPIEVSYSDMELDGERRFVGFVRDITVRKRAERELREHQEQFRVAREIQQRLFPKAAPELPGFDVGGCSYPAEAAGGDYFDFLPMVDDCLGVVVGDVSGHGVGPALLMADTRAYLRLLTTRRKDVGEILTYTNLALAEDVGGERYVTLFFGRLDPHARTLTFASAGHSPCYLLDAEGQAKMTLKCTDVPLGIEPDTNYASSQDIPLAPGDLLLLTTDGIEEACSPDNVFFGVERALEVVRANRQKPAREIVEALYQAVYEFSRGSLQFDDITAIVVKVES
jgi:PAS domain S-box-containing protein